MNEKPLVLIVDDEEIFLEIAAVQLRKAGLRTTSANNVPDALEKAERLLPDFVLSDIYMPPGPSGWELALALRRNPKTSAIKFAFFTSLRDPWMELRGDRNIITKELGSVLFFSKVDNVDIFADRIIDLLHGVSAS